MKLTPEQLKRIAKFARIEFSDDEIADIIPELNNILSLIQQLDEVDTEGVPQIDQITGLMNIMEADEIKSFLDTEKLVSCSPQPVKNNMIEVKKSK